MATFVHLEEGHGGLLPPLREIFLEVQVNKLIQEYLFSSNADERRSFLRDGLSDNEEMKAPNDQIHVKDMALQIGCDCTIKHPEPLNYHHKQNCLHNSHRMQTTCREGKEECLHATDVLHDTSIAALSVDHEGQLIHKSSYLNRVDTFPSCTSKAQSYASTPHKVTTDLKVSCKKPPRPPSRVPKPGQLSPSLTRSCSDNGACLQSSKRAKLERKRKAMATYSVDTSIWALLFTLCFAIIMIAQGFWSQDSQKSAFYGATDASSPKETVMTTASSNILLAEVIGSSGAAERQASTEGVYAFEAARRALP